MRSKKLLLNPFWVAGVIWKHGLTRLIKDDRFYLKVAYFLSMNGKVLNLEHPRTYSEKLQWLKLNERHEEYTKMVDKVQAKDYVAGIIGDKYIIPTLGVWEKFDDINFDRLPNQFVLKCSHDSQGFVICRDKSKLDIEAARKKINRCLKRNYYWCGREYPYRDVPKRILAEELMVDESGTELKDYKFFCFDGEVKMLYVASERGKATKFDYFDLDFNHLPFRQSYPISQKKLVKPKNFDKMIEVARRLSQGFRHVRVDLYNVNGAIYFGELTFFNNAGLLPFQPHEWDYRIGEWLKLPV